MKLLMTKKIKGNLNIRLISILLN